MEDSRAQQSLAAEYGKYVATTYIFSWTLLIFGVKHGWGMDYLNVSGAGPAMTALFLARSRTFVQSRGARWFCLLLDDLRLILSARQPVNWD